MRFVTQAEFCAAKIIEQGGDSLIYIEHLFLNYSKKSARLVKASTIRNILSKITGEKVSSRRALNAMRFLAGIGVGQMKDTGLIRTSQFEWVLDSQELAFHVIDRLTENDRKAA